MNSKMDTQWGKAFFENLKSHQVTSENEMKLIKFCMISTKLFSGDSSWWLEPCVCRNFSLCARDHATHTHVFHTDTHMCTQHLQIHPQLNCSRFYECQQHEGCLPLPLPHISLPLSLPLSITLSLSIALSLSSSLAHSLCNSLFLCCLRCWESSFILFCFFPLLWIFVSISWWEKSPADLSLLFLVFSSFSLSLSRHVSWFQTLNLSLCLSLDPAFPMHLPAAEGYRDSSLPSFSPAPTPAPPPLPPLLHLSSSRFLTEG